MLLIRDQLFGVMRSTHQLVNPKLKPCCVSRFAHLFFFVPSLVGWNGKKEWSNWSVFCLCARYATSCPQPSHWRNRCIKGPLQLGHSKIANRHHICTQRTVCYGPSERAISFLESTDQTNFCVSPKPQSFLLLSLCRMQPFIYHSHKRLSIAREEIASSTPRRLDPNPLAPSTLFPSNFFCFSLPSHFLSESPSERVSTFSATNNRNRPFALPSSQVRVRVSTYGGREWESLSWHSMTGLNRAISRFRRQNSPRPSPRKRVERREISSSFFFLSYVIYVDMMPCQPIIWESDDVWPLHRTRRCAMRGQCHISTLGSSHSRNKQSIWHPIIYTLLLFLALCLP